VPKDSFRQNTACRRARSRALFVGSTSCPKNVHSHWRWSYSSRHMPTRRGWPLNCPRSLIWQCGQRVLRSGSWATFPIPSGRSELRPSKRQGPQVLPGERTTIGRIRQAFDSGVWRFNACTGGCHGPQYSFPPTIRTR
jgi:hypothetical protein